MLASLALRTEFNRSTRELGDQQAAERRVEIMGGGSESVRAQVLDTPPGIATIRRSSHGDATEFTASCTCPAFARGGDPCEHVWATLVVAERAGHLNGLPDAPPLTRESAFLTLRGQPPQAEPTPPQVHLSTRPAPSTMPAPLIASAFLHAVGGRIRASRLRPTTTFPFADATLLYVIDAPATTSTGSTVLTVMEQRRSKIGGVYKPRAAKLTPEDAAAAPPTDRRILALLSGGAKRHAAAWLTRSIAPDTTSFALPDALAVEVLPLVARTARLWIKTASNSTDLVPLAWDDGNAWTFRLQIDTTPSGYRVDGRLERDNVYVRLDEGAVVLAGALVAVRRTLVRFTADESAAFLEELRRHGPIEVPAAQTTDLLTVLAESGTPPDDLPEPLRAADLRVTPRPRLALRRPRDTDGAWLAASVSFDYDGSVVEARTAGESVFDAATRRVIHRQLGPEANATARLRDLGFRIADDGGGHALEVAQHRFSSVVRTLVDDGWLVEAEGVRYRAARHVRLAITSGIDWFDLSARVPFDDGETTDLAAVLAAIEPGRPMVQLGDGSIGLVPEEWLARYGTLLSTGEARDGRIRFRRSQVALLDALLAVRIDRTELETDAAFDRARAELAEGTEIAPREEPASFTGTLRPYQREGLGWFDFLRRFGFGGCLADDMGLGKTIMVLALLDGRRTATEGDGPHRPSLVVVPRSLVGNWLAEAQRFAPALRILDHSHGARDESTAHFADHDVVLVTYGTLRRDIEPLAAIEFDYAVLDEAQTIKNASTASAKATRLIRARHRLALSGTPIENHLGELWSLFEFLNPGILGRSSLFHRAATSTDDLHETTAILARGLRPFVLRRTKQQVARELPARTEQTIACELLPKDRRLYERLRLHYRTSVLDRVSRDGLAKSKMHVLEALLRLRQASCHAGLVDPARAKDESAKFDVLIPRLQEVADEGHKALVFSQFTTLLGLLATRLDAAKIRYEYLDGKTRDRTTRVERFQSDPAISVFLISLKAGGLGLNLTAADYVFLLDPWWNPAVEAQAIDRAHRIGQTREVFAYRVIAKDTVEEKVLQLQRSKRALADAVLSADAVGLRNLSREDLELLLD